MVVRSEALDGPRDIMVPFEPVMALMTVMAIKHYCADFLFQTSAIARGKAASHDWLLPLSLHALGHAVITVVIALVCYPSAWWVAAIEFVVHAAIDRLKAMVANATKLDPTMPRYWWLLGFDQLLHQLTNIAIIGVFLAV